MDSENIIVMKDIAIIRSGTYILKDISLTIKKGENWAIIGRNGSGKSFLLRIISTLIYPSEGTIELYGHKFGEVNVWELRHKIGIVSDLLQREYKGTAKVHDVIISGFYASIGLYEPPTTEQIQKAEEVMKKLGITKFSEREFESLSQGEQKKVLIGRALVFDPELLILDEPTSGLDVASREDFLATLRHLLEYGHNILFVTHHIEEIIPEINKVLFIAEGKIHQYGDKEDMMTPVNLTKVLGIDFKIKKNKGRYWPIMYDA